MITSRSESLRSRVFSPWPSVGLAREARSLPGRGNGLAWSACAVPPAQSGLDNVSRASHSTLGGSRAAAVRFSDGSQNVSRARRLYPDSCRAPDIGSAGRQYPRRLTGLWSRQRYEPASAVAWDLSRRGCILHGGIRVGPGRVVRAPYEING